MSSTLVTSGRIREPKLSASSNWRRGSVQQSAVNKVTPDEIYVVFQFALHRNMDVFQYAYIRFDTTMLKKLPLLVREPS